MTGAEASNGTRYRAFISYSHKDAVFANRLHRRLENYVLPKSFGGSRSLKPIFKDRDELPAAHDLGEQVRAALDRSDCLIVVCSPDAAASQWVGREIAAFRAIGPDRPILAALVRGEPVESFPSELLMPEVEPLAADFRKLGDGDRLALLKLAAGLAGVGVDQLVQRDAQRRLRNVTTITALAVASVVVMAGMTTFAIAARIEAESQRTAAEGLVEFMLTDLRDKLKAVGRLEVMDAVNDRAVTYYTSRDLSNLGAKSLMQRAKLFIAIGEDEIRRGNLNVALSHFLESKRITYRLYDTSPSNPEFILAHAQSEYWIGYIHYLRKETIKSRSYWQSYLRLSESLLNMDPRRSKYQQEVGFAFGNLCTLAIEQEPNPTYALAACRQALTFVKMASANSDDSTSVLTVANRHAWMADAFELAGQTDEAFSERWLQDEILSDQLMFDPNNAGLRESWGGSQRALGRLAFRRRDYSEASKRMANARKTFAQLSEADPENIAWRNQVSIIDRDISVINKAKSQEIQDGKLPKVR